MVNRRGAIFNRSLFKYVKYAEISELERAACDLMDCGHARLLTPADYAAFVNCLSKDGLVTGAKAAGFTAIRTSWAKPKLIEYFLAAIPFADAASIAVAKISLRLPTPSRSSFCSTSISARPKTT
jgi:DNA polymerase III subunit epsilon